MKPSRIRRDIQSPHARSGSDGPGLGRVARVREMDLSKSQGSRRGSGRRRSGLALLIPENQRKALLIWSIALTVGTTLVIGGFVWYWLRTRGGAAAAAEPDIRPGAERVVSRFASPTEDEALALVRRGLAARDAESVGHCFRLGQAKPAEVISFLADLEREHGKPDRLDWLSSMDTEGMLLEGVLVTHERDGAPAERIAFLIPDDRGVWRIDFEAFARMCRPALGELAKPEVQSAVVRVFIAKDSYFNGPFRDDSQWLCFAMASPDLGDKESGDRTVMRGYCKTESPQAKALLQLFADGGRMCRTTLEIRKVEGADDMQFEIMRVLSGEWVTGERPLDAKYGAL